MSYVLNFSYQMYLCTYDINEILTNHLYYVGCVMPCVTHLINMFMFIY